MTVKVLTMVALAAIAAGALGLTEPAEAAKEQFERNKPHVNVGTSGTTAKQPDASVKQPAPEPEPPVEKPQKKQVPTQP